MSIIEKLGITNGKLVVRTKVDDSGDYIRKSCDILSHFPWGDRGIVYEMENPNEARLFCASPDMLEALIDNLIDNINHTFNETYARLSRIHSQENIMVRAERTHSETINIIERATGKSWEEIKQLL